MGLSRTVWILVVARAVNQLGAFTLPFLAVTLVEEHGASLAGAGWVLAGFGLATIPSRLGGGRLAEAIGARATIVLGLVGTALAQLALAAAPSLATAVVAAVALGLVFEVYEPPSQAMVADVTPAGQQHAAYGALAAAMAVAGVGAGLLAAVLAHVDLRWLFVVDAATCLACAVVAGALLPGGRHRVVDHARTAEPAGPPASPWRDRRLLAMLGLGTGFAVVYLQVTIALPLTLDLRGLPPSTLGLLLTLSALTLVVGQPVLRRLTFGGDPVRAMSVGYAVLAAGLVLNGVATSLPAFAVATVVWSVGDLLLLGHALRVVAGLAPPGAHARYLAAHGTSWGVAAVLAPLVGTQLLARTGPTTTWLVVAGGALLLAVLQPRVRTARPASAAPATPART